jgi:transposase InsO family protein|tara:strand:- start:157 stop:1020 length:864 start_codon:yes stop_codon:yes gene_type:complete
MKLTKTKLLETIRRKNDGWTTYQARKIARISIRRVNQVYGDYLQTGKIPEIGKKVGRPSKPMTDGEIRIVKEAYGRYRVCASTLRRVIDRDYGIRINHNRIHKIMVTLGLAKPLKDTHKRKKDWIRYERRHSLTAVHIDWYYDPIKEKWVFAVEDDASRKMLALLEVDSATTDWSIGGMRQALKHGKIKQCISDHGAQFIHNLGGESRFQAFLEEQGIKQILCRIKHPQSNGKVEKWFQVYKNHRHAFDTKEEFLVWYNEVRPHLSLRIDELETPHLAFIRKMKAEV